MDFLHSQFDGGPGDLAIVTLDRQANVMLLNEANFSAYRAGSGFSYLGGWATASPVRLGPPTFGHWHVVVDLGGRGGQVRSGIRVVRTAA